jgi:DNA-binding response OmpR family regulator
MWRQPSALVQWPSLLGFVNISWKIGFDDIKISQIWKEPMSLKRILVVDDEEAIRLLLEVTLEEYGYEILVTDSALKSLEIIERNLLDDWRIGLIILDIKMEEMNGLEALPRIFGLDEDMRVILYTAYSQYQDSFMGWSPDAYITKSGDLGELVGKVKELLD